MTKVVDCFYVDNMGPFYINTVNRDISYEEFKENWVEWADINSFLIFYRDDESEFWVNPSKCKILKIMTKEVEDNIEI